MRKISSIVLNLRFPTRLLCCVDNKYKVVRCPDSVYGISVYLFSTSVRAECIIAGFGPKIPQSAT